MKLSILEEGTRSELTLPGPVITIGRSVDNDIRLASTLVSRHHARIELDGESAWVIDLGSANGTKVNGEKVTRRLLEPGDKLQIGGVHILLEAERIPGTSETQELERAEIGLRTLTGEARRERENLHVFARVTRELARETDLGALLRLIVDSAIALSGAERGFLLLAERHEGALPATPAEVAERELLVRVARNFDRSDIPVPSSRLSQGIARKVFQSQKPLLSVDAGRDERFREMASVEDLKLRSVMCLPVRIEGQVEGVLYVDNRLQQSAFDQDALDLLEQLADMAAIAIKNARLVSELRVQNQRLSEQRRQIERLNEQLGRKVRDQGTELAVVRAELDRERGRYDYTAIVGASDGMHEVFKQLDRIIDSELPVLIHGESGTGKELIARAIHFNGPRKARPFVSENCAALPDTLLESELFGHARGAFTGAHKQKKGLIEQADGGTLFLDEIGDMSPEMQKKLLRVLQEGEFRPVGSDQRIQVNVRLLAASHRDLEELVRNGEFREDLYYRVNVLSVRLPPLRERRDDIPLLAESLLARAAREAGRPAPVLSHEALAGLVSHDWPGNVRELENEMRRLVVLAQGEVRLEHLSRSVLERKSPRSAGGPPVLLDAGGDIKSAVADLEKRSIEAALAHAGGNKSKAASELGISRFALQRKLDKYGLSKSRGKDEVEEGELEDESEALGT
ncbi:MAG: sigma 54-interacting transcriptional regulator [Planctomycetota bacterium]